MCIRVQASVGTPAPSLLGKFLYSLKIFRSALTNFPMRLLKVNLNPQFWIHSTALMYVMLLCFKYKFHRKLVFTVQCPQDFGISLLWNVLLKFIQENILPIPSKTGFFSEFSLSRYVIDSFCFLAVIAR